MLKPTFPESIHTESIDEMLLEFSSAANAVVEQRLKFIYYYQILEYAAHYAIGEKTRRELTSLLRSPDLQAAIDEYLPRIVDAFADQRLMDEQRLERVIQERSVPDHVWPEIQANLSYFSTNHVFEGGFALEPFVTSDTSLELLKNTWGTKAPSAFKKIRNALVHGRESRSNSVIAPTRTNDKLLQPWVAIIQRVTEDVIIFKL
jgi:hypothetical protein